WRGLALLTCSDRPIIKKGRAGPMRLHQQIMSIQDPLLSLMVTHLLSMSLHKWMSVWLLFNNNSKNNNNVKPNERKNVICIINNKRKNVVCIINKCLKCNDKWMKCVECGNAELAAMII
ncbi:hypothetical protein L1987_02720, partial [Smallanthus sonchifolius]